MAEVELPLSTPEGAFLLEAAGEVELLFQTSPEGVELHLSILAVVLVSRSSEEVEVGLQS